MTLNVATDGSVTDADAVFARWLKEFSEAMESLSIDRIIGLVTTDCYWRDLLALTWDLGTFHGHAAIAELLEEDLRDASTSNFQTDPGCAPRVLPGDHGPTIEAFYLFETPTAW